MDRRREPWPFRRLLVTECAGLDGTYPKPRRVSIDEHAEVGGWTSRGVRAYAESGEHHERPGGRALHL